MRRLPGNMAQAVRRIAARFCLIPLIAIGLSTGAHAQTAVQADLGMLQARADAAANSCRLADLQALETHFTQFERLMAFRRVESKELTRLTGDSAHMARVKQTYKADDTAYLMRAALHHNCAAEQLETQIYDAEKTCAYDEADRLFGLLDARASGDAAARAARERAFIALGESREHPKRCRKSKKDQRNETARHSFQITSAIQAERAARREVLLDDNICVDPPEQIAASCARWQPLLGSWINPQFGGVIEFHLIGETTANARIVTASTRMAQHGYSAGMEILRGWHITSPLADELRFSADQGQSFSPQGNAGWSSGGAIQIEKTRPGIVNLPGDIAGPIAHFEDFIRLGPASGL